MRSPRPAAAALLSAAVLLTAGCQGDSPSTTPTPTPATSATSASYPPVSPSISTTSNPEPTSTLTAKEQQAVNDATQALMSARQIGVDLYSGARTRINDLDSVTSGDFHDETVSAIGQNLAKGWKTTPTGVQLGLVSARPIKVNLDKDPPTVVIRACVDATEAIAVAPDGKTSPGTREELDYTVVYTTDRPAAVWAVSGVKGAAKVEDRSC